MKHVGFARRIQPVDAAASLSVAVCAARRLIRALWTACCSGLSHGFHAPVAAPPSAPEHIADAHAGRRLTPEAPPRCMPAAGAGELTLSTHSSRS
jgi:hypothetical protein